MGLFEDIDEITMFADYRVPQAMVYFDMIRYTPALLDRLATDPYLPSGDELEQEIRAASILGVEKVKQAMLELYHQETGAKKPPAEEGEYLNAAVIDFYLWDTAKSLSREMAHIPIHKTTSIFY